MGKMDSKIFISERTSLFIQIDRENNLRNEPGICNS